VHVLVVCVDNVFIYKMQKKHSCFICVLVFNKNYFLFDYFLVFNTFQCGAEFSDLRFCVETGLRVGNFSM